MKLSREFYLNADVVEVARRLLGKEVVTKLGGLITSGMITETEAYAGVDDRASHAFGGRRTGRTEVMYARGGTAYVYLCYGMHSLFNVVTHKEGIPHAVLIRAIFPLRGLSLMLERSAKKKAGRDFSDGPGKVSKVLGIHYSHSGLDLLGDQIWIEDRGLVISDRDIVAGPRIGVDYAGEDAKLPYRMLLKEGAAEKLIKNL